jgi:hypothetical protein
MKNWMVSTDACPSHLILWFPPTQFTINNESTMDPFCRKLQVERGNYMHAYTRGFCSSTRIQIEQSTNQPKLLTNPEIQLEACIITERSMKCLLTFEYPKASQLSSVAIMLYSCGNYAPHSTLPLKLLRNWAYPNLSCSFGHILLHFCSLFVCHHTPSGFHDNKKIKSCHRTILCIICASMHYQKFCAFPLLDEIPSYSWV